MIVEEIEGDILQATENYIAQQCNCVTTKPHGLSEIISQHFPHGDVYGKRKKKSANTAMFPDEPGSVVITEHAGYPTLLHMMAQWAPGKIGTYCRYYPTTYRDTRANRESWFANCLTILDSEVPSMQVVAMPGFIGCGQAGGHWDTYKDMLRSCNTKIKLYYKAPATK